MFCFVTGAAGFIGSNLVDRLISLGYHVLGYDNLSTGKLEFLNLARNSPRFSFIEGDLLDFENLKRSMHGCDIVFHLAANADVRFGPVHTFKDLQQNTIATYNVLESMRCNNIKTIAFSSTGSVYGEASVIPTPENCPFPIQTSLYGNSKIAAEGLITSYSEAFDISVYIFRFVSILGERYSHGHVIDFYKKLSHNPNHLEILGNGHQKKSYLYIHDCIDAMFIAMKNAKAKINIINIGHSEYCEVNFSVGVICKELGLQPILSYTGGDRGWVGDNPFIFLDCSKMRSLGWVPQISIEQAIIKTVNFISNNELVLKDRL